MNQSFKKLGKQYHNVIRLFSKKSSISSTQTICISKTNTISNFGNCSSVVKAKQSNEKQQISEHGSSLNAKHINGKKQITKKFAIKGKHETILLNKKITACTSCNEILNLIEHSLDTIAGGGHLNHIGLATSVNRLARHMSRNKIERSKIIGDERFAKLFACVAEAMVSQNIVNTGDLKHNNVRIQFGIRELANIGWAIAKLNITIPSSKLPLLQTIMQQEEDNKEIKKSRILSESSQTILATTKMLRDGIAINATNSVISKKTATKKHTIIIPYYNVLATLSSQLMDYIGIVFSSNINNTDNTGDTTIPNMQNCVNLYWAWATTRRADQKVFESVASFVVTRRHELFGFYSVDTLHPQSISNSLWAMATADLYQSEKLTAFMELIAEMMKNRYPPLKNYNSQALSNSVWASSKLATNQKNVFNQKELNDGSTLAVDLTKRMQLSSLTIINIVAKEVIQRKATGFNAQELSNTAWAFATVNSKEIKLIQNATHQIIEKSLQTLPVFNDQNAGILVWAVAQLIDSKSSIIDTLFQRVGKHLLDKTRQVSPRSVCMTMSGFAKLKFIDDSLYRSLASRLFTNKASLLESQSISNAIWALATAGISVQCEENSTIDLPIQPTSNTTAQYQASIDPVLHCCAVAANEFIQRPHEFSKQEISNLCWSFATLGVKDTTFLTKVEQEIESRITNVQKGMPDGMGAFNGQEVANILWSFATLNCIDCNLLQYLEPYILEMCKDKTSHCIQKESIANFFDRHNLCNIAWSCAVFGKYPDTLMKTLYLGQFGSGSFEDMHHLTKIYGDDGPAVQACLPWIHVQTSMGLAQSKIGLSLPINFPDDWIQNDASSTSEMSQVSWPISTSKFQKDVSKSLKSMGFSHMMEHTISMKDLVDKYSINVPIKDMSVFSIDIANVEKKIAIEVDGPTHFLHTIDSRILIQTGKSYSSKITDEPNGSTMFKRRLLMSMGWTVLSVPYWEWHSMKGNQQREEYCHRLLHNSNT